MKRHVFALLLMLVALLALALAALWVTPSGQWRHVRWQAPEAQMADYASMVAELPAPASADTRRFVTMLERPLFSPTRRPPPVTPKEGTSSADAMGNAQLVGLFEGAKDAGALVRIDGKIRRMRLNELIDGWTLSAVRGRSATFTRAGGTRVLELQRADLSVDPAQPLVPGAPPKNRPPTKPEPQVDPPKPAPQKAEPAAAPVPKAEAPAPQTSVQPKAGAKPARPGFGPN